MAAPGGGLRHRWLHALLDRSRQPPLVGRGRELSLLLQRLTAAGRGESSIVVLSGEPGVGKTRLLTELADDAAATGWWVLVGQALDSEGMPPYLPFVEALHEYVRVSTVDDLRMQLGDSAPEVAIVLPEIARRLTDLPASKRLEGEGQRYPVV